jgi:hypothetical protein
MDRKPETKNEKLETSLRFCIAARMGFMKRRETKTLFGFERAAAVSFLTTKHATTSPQTAETKHSQEQYLHTMKSAIM